MLKRKIFNSLFVSLLFVITLMSACTAQESVNFSRQQKSNSDGCSFPELELPNNFVVYLAGGYSGQPLPYQIDNSGHMATQMNIVANSPSKPVVLMLGAYEPTIWNVHWTEGTDIVGVLASGFHRQAIAGLPEDTPLMISTSRNDNKCGYFYPQSQRYDFINSLSEKLFGQTVEKTFGSRGSLTVVGEPFEDEDDSVVLSSIDTLVNSFYDPSLPLAGEAALEEALLKGVIRKATEADAKAWLEAQQKLAPEQNSYLPSIGSGYPDAYVVLSDFTYPEGVHGKRFFVPEGVPLPKGNPTQSSSILNFNTGKCSGPICSI